MGGPEKPGLDPQQQRQREIARQERVDTIKSDVGDLTRQLMLRFGSRATGVSRAGGLSPAGKTEGTFSSF